MPAFILTKISDSGPCVVRVSGDELPLLGFDLPFLVGRQDLELLFLHHKEGRPPFFVLLVPQLVAS